jgi:hypothetical protein
MLRRHLLAHLPASICPVRRHLGGTESRLYTALGRSQTTALLALHSVVFGISLARFCL